MSHAVVTGATNGLGEAIACRLASRHRTVTLVGRNWSRLVSARDRIAAAVPGAHLLLAQTDLAELDQVQELAERLGTGSPPDIVVSNAAVVSPLDRVNSRGIPHVLAINYFAPYLLIRALASVAVHCRFVIIGSDPVLLDHDPVDLEDVLCRDVARLGIHADLWPYYAYARSKNMNTMFAYALSSRLMHSRVTVNVCHPGLIAGTGLGRDIPGLAANLMQAHKDGILPQPGPQPGVGHWEYGKSDSTSIPGPNIAAHGPVWMATSPELVGVSGQFYVGRTRVSTAPHTSNPERCEKLWQESALLVGISS